MYWTSGQALLAFSNVLHFTSLLSGNLLLESPLLDKELWEQEGILHVWCEQQLSALLDAVGLPRRTLQCEEEVDEIDGGGVRQRYRMSLSGFGNVVEDGLDKLES